MSINRRHDIYNFATLCAYFPKILSNNMLILGFHTTDALAVAKHAELQTVGLHEAVFLQGFGVRFRGFPVYLRSTIMYYCMLVLCPHWKFAAGDIGHEFYFVLQGSVNIVINEKVIKVRFPPSKIFGPHTPSLPSRPSHADHHSLHRSLEKRLRSEKLPCNSNASALPRLDNSWAGMHMGMSFGHVEAIKLCSLRTHT